MATKTHAWSARPKGTRAHSCSVMGATTPLTSSARDSTTSLLGLGSATIVKKTPKYSLEKFAPQHEAGVVRRGGEAESLVGKESGVRSSISSISTSSFHSMKKKIRCQITREYRQSAGNFKNGALDSTWQPDMVPRPAFETRQRFCEIPNLSHHIPSHKKRSEHGTLSRKREC